MRRDFPELSEAKDRHPNGARTRITLDSPGFALKRGADATTLPHGCPNAALLTTAEKPGEKVQTGFGKEDCGNKMPQRH